MTEREIFETALSWLGIVKCEEVITEMGVAVDYNDTNYLGDPLIDERFQVKSPDGIGVYMIYDESGNIIKGDLNAGYSMSKNGVFIYNLIESAKFRERNDAIKKST
jgi:hypothetical protein